MSVLIELEDVEKTYSDGTRAVRGVSFSINRGEFVSIMGPSGSGKSTILHIIGFLDKHTAGTYHFDGKTFDDYSPDAVADIRNKRMGFVFQMFNLLPRASVLENVKLPLLYSDIPQSEWDERALSVIEKVGLSHRAHFEPAKLSGGEKQRAAIARALVTNPDIIFADEPTGNLDSKSGQMIMMELQRLHDEGRTVVLITHETYTAEHADRIIRILDGKVDSDSKVSNIRSGKDGLFK
jgi:putative ABC transport system ATP-binding protein